MPSNMDQMIVIDNTKPEVAISLLSTSPQVINYVTGVTEVVMLWRVTFSEVVMNFTADQIAFTAVTSGSEEMYGNVTIVADERTRVNPWAPHYSRLSTHYEHPTSPESWDAGVILPRQQLHAYRVEATTRVTGAFRVRIHSEAVFDTAVAGNVESNSDQLAFIEWDARIDSFETFPFVGVDPIFHRDTYAYEGNLLAPSLDEAVGSDAVIGEVVDLVISFNTTDPKATVVATLNGVVVPASNTTDGFGNHTYHFAPALGDNNLLFSVTAFDGVNSKVYSMFLIRQEEENAAERAAMDIACAREDFFVEANNWCDKNVSLCNWEGVGCTSMRGFVEHIDLTGYNLTNTIPSELGALSRLTSLKLSGNELEGTLPAELANTSLVTLEVHDNYLTGTMPRDLMGLQTLDYINCNDTWLLDATLCAPLRGDGAVHRVHAVLNVETPDWLADVDALLAAVDQVIASSESLVSGAFSVAAIETAIVSATRVADYKYDVVVTIQGVDETTVAFVAAELFDSDNTVSDELLSELVSHGAAVTTDLARVTQSIHVILPVAPAATTWVDMNGDHQVVSGSLVIERPTDESTFLDYFLYVGDAEGRKGDGLGIGTDTHASGLIARISKHADNITFELTDLQIGPSTHFLVYAVAAGPVSAYNGNISDWTYDDSVQDAAYMSYYEQTPDIREWGSMLKPMLASEPLVVPILDVVQPTITRQPQGGVLAEGTDYLTPVVVRSGDFGVGFEYDWRKLNETTGEMESIGQYNDMLQLSNVTSGSAGSYLVVSWLSSNSSFMVVSDFANITVDELPIFTYVGSGETEATTTEVRMGDTFSIDNVSVTNTDNMNSTILYQWVHDSEVAEGHTSQTLILTNFSQADVGTWYVVASNGVAVSQSRAYLITTNTCHNHTCLNGGQCVEYSDHYLCSCPRDFAGTRCEIPTHSTAGCADGTREGFTDTVKHRHLAACRGVFVDYVAGSDAQSLCSAGFHVCSANLPGDRDRLFEVDASDAAAFEGCYAYDAAQNNGGCTPCAANRNQDIMAGVGSSCKKIGLNAKHVHGVGRTDSNTSCLSGGRIDAVAPGDYRTGAACAAKPWTIGVVCCADATRDDRLDAAAAATATTTALTRAVSSSSSIAQIAAGLRVAVVNKGLNGWDELVMDDDEPNLPPIVFRNGPFTLLQGAMGMDAENALGRAPSAGREHPLIRLPAAYTPSVAMAFVVSPAYTGDFEQPITTLVVHVEPSGFVFLDENPAKETSTVSLDGIRFPHATAGIATGAELVGMQMAGYQAVAPEEGFEHADPDHYAGLSYFADADGTVHLTGVLRLMADCDNECVIARLPVGTTTLPSWGTKTTSVFLAGNDNQGHIDVHGGNGVATLSSGKAGDLIIMSSIRLLSSEQTAHGSIHYVTEPELVGPQWVYGSGPARIVRDTLDQVHMAGRVYYNAKADGYTHSTGGLIDEAVMVLDEGFCPDYLITVPVACGVAAGAGGEWVREVCRVTISPDCEVRVTVSSSHDNDALTKGLWVSFDGVLYGGYEFSTTTSVGQDATIQMSGGGAAMHFN